MKLEPLKSIEISAIEFPAQVPVPPFANQSKLADRIFGAFCRINPELPCMEDKKFIKNVFKCIKAAGGPDLSTNTDLVTFVKSDREIAKWRSWYAEQKDIKAVYRKEHKDELKRYNETRKANYGFALVNGVKEPLQSWVLEPEGIFFGRGDSPINGLWKTSTNLVVNTNSDNHIDALFTVDGVVQAQPYVFNKTWNPNNHVAATYNVEIGVPGKKPSAIRYKGISFGAASSVKKEGQSKKYSASSELGKSYGEILKKVDNDFKTLKTAELGTTIAVFLLFEKGIRIGGKSATENGTKGLLSLEWNKDVKRVDNQIKFDFYGKDSVHDLSVIETEYAERIEKHWSKYSQLDTDQTKIRNYINEIVPELEGIFTPKLARTAVAAYTVQRAFDEMIKHYKVTTKSTDALKKLAFDEAAMYVARRLNHQRGVNKVAEEKRKAKFKESAEKLKERENKLKEQIAKKETRIEVLKKKGDKAKVRELKEQIQNAKEKLKQAKMNLSSKERNQNFTATTAINSYVDPALVKEYCERVDLPLEKVYSKVQIEKFFGIEKEV